MIYTHVLNRGPAGCETGRPPRGSISVRGAGAWIHSRGGLDIQGLRSAGARMGPVRAKGAWPKALPGSCGRLEISRFPKISSKDPCYMVPATKR